MNTPEVSVIMSVYKEPEADILAAVESILAQTLENFELVIVNDNPEDPTTKRILEKVADKDERITIVHNERNLGLGQSLNNAVSHAEAPILARMDTLDVSLPERLTTQLSYMRAHPETDLLFTQWYERDGNGNQTIRAIKRKDVEDIEKKFFTKSLLLHPTLMIKKEILVQHPYPAMGRPEDFVLFLELIRNKYAFSLIEKPLYIYNIDRTNEDERYNKIRTYSENYLPALLKELRWYWPSPQFWLHIFRVGMEYVVSRNRYVFRYTHGSLGYIWKRMFRSA